MPHADDPIRLRPPLDSMFVTSPFGLRRSPITGRPEGHGGVDLRAPLGTPVYAAEDGIVARSYFSEGNPSHGVLGYGNRIVLDHARGWETSYAHLDRRCVVRGQAVVAGQLIGYAGRTGASTGPHLHWELRLGDVQHDPMRYLAEQPNPEEVAK